MDTRMKFGLVALGLAAPRPSPLPPHRAGAQNGMAADTGQVWDAFGGNQQAQKYSTATQITPDNAKDLKQAWEVHTGDVASGPHETTWGATPLFVNNTVYVGTPKFRIYAVEPDTGKVKWSYAAGGANGKPANQGYKNRGVAYWAAATPTPGQPCQKMVYIGTMDGELHGVDADTGKLCDGFGNHGVVNVNAWNTINNKWPVGSDPAARRL